MQIREKFMWVRYSKWQTRGHNTYSTLHNAAYRTINEGVAHWFSLELSGRLWYIINIKDNRPQGGLTKLRSRKIHPFARSKFKGGFSM